MKKGFLFRWMVCGMVTVAAVQGAMAPGSQVTAAREDPEAASQEGPAEQGTMEQTGRKDLEAASQEDPANQEIVGQTAPEAASQEERAEQGTMEQTGRVAEAEAAHVEVGKYGMLPIYGFDVVDGTYPVEVRSSSTMFRVVEAELTVENGRMEAVLTLSGTGYSRLFMGTGQEAVRASEAEFIDFVENEDGQYTYTVPVEALDKKLDCAAFSRRKEMWYERTLLFEASSLPKEALLVELPDYDRIEAALEAWENAENEETAPSQVPDTEAKSAAEALPETEDQTSVDAGAQSGSSPVTPMSVDLEDGEYAIELSLMGGSGKASVVSPTLLTVREGRAYARLQWSSSNYDYMIVGTEKYLNENTEGGNSLFQIPVEAMDRELSVIADTTAMGTPHEVEYALTFYSDTIGPKSQLPQEAAKRVVIIALAIILGGGVLNHYVNKKRRR